MPQDAIFLLGNDGQLVEMNEAEYDSEDVLQSLLGKYPNLLAGKQMNSDSPRRWLLISREVPVASDESATGRWSLDHLFLDQDGIPTLVEVKRRSDTRIRREVVGQLLDYAANAVLYWPVEDIRNRFESRCGAAGEDCESVLRESLGSEINAEQFWSSVKTNLQAGKIRLVFVAHEIPAELQRIVEFLNGQMDPAEVIAVQVKQYEGGELTTLVPRVIGQTAEATAKKTRGGKRQWDEASFFDDLASRSGPEDCDVARKLLEWACASDYPIRWGQGRTFGTFYPVLRCMNGNHLLFGVDTSGKVEVDFVSKPEEVRDSKIKLLQQLNSIGGISLPEKSIDSWGNFLIAALREENRRQEFLKAIQAFAHALLRAGTENQQA